jgi:hypothetical protein
MEVNLCFHLSLLLVAAPAVAVLVDHLVDPAAAVAKVECLMHLVALEHLVKEIMVATVVMMPMAANAAVAAVVLVVSVKLVHRQFKVFMVVTGQHHLSRVHQ